MKAKAQQGKLSSSTWHDTVHLISRFCIVPAKQQPWATSLCHSLVPHTNVDLSLRYKLSQPIFIMLRTRNASFFSFCNLPVFLLMLVLASCHTAAEKIEAEPAAAVTPVTVTSIQYEPMEEFIDLNATSTFLQKWIVRSNATGYLQKSYALLNKYVNNGQVLYTVKTKEAQSIGNSIKILDSTFQFSGVNTIKAIGSGFISQVDRQQGDYVQDGDQLAVITDTKSFIFILQLPYELRPYIRNKKSLQMVLPDGEKLWGTIAGEMPAMDSSAQTQRIILKVNTGHPIPENLIAKVRVVKSQQGRANSLPKAALLSNETQDEFWVMKMIDSGTAAKVPIKKGIETDNLVEIISPQFSANDKFLITGNYGLGDTAKVKVMAVAAKED